MNEEGNVPFFINTKRRQTADSYYSIGRTQEKVRKFLIECRKSNAVTIPCEDLQGHASVGFYGVNRYISLEPDPEEGEDTLDRDFIEIDEDVQFENTSAFELFWMTFKRIAHSFGEHFSTSTLPRGAPRDLENNQVQELANEQLYKSLVDPSSCDPRIKQNRIIYGDANYLIQKFRMDLNCGSLDIALFSVEFPTSQAGSFESTDLQAYVVAPECGSFVWIENGKASAIFMTKSSENFFGNVMEWFRKILSDMTLADSVMIGHPYYWHAPVRRRLTKVMRYLKRLYRTLALKDRERNTASDSGEVQSNSIAVICPEQISKIVINEQPSENLAHSTCTYEKLNMMLDQLVKKWFQYKRNLELSYGHSISDVSSAWATDNPQSVKRALTGEGNFLESVTFLDFHPDQRVEQCDQNQEPGSVDISSPDENNNNSINISSDEESLPRDVSTNGPGDFHVEGYDTGGSSVGQCELRSRKSAISIDIEESEDPRICSDNKSTTE